MKKTSFLLTITVAALLVSTSASFGAVVYTQTSTTGLTTSFATLPTVLDDINFAATTTGTQELSAMTFGLGVAPSTLAQTALVFVDFYDTVNSASTGVVESNYLGGFNGNLTITANTSTTATSLRSFSFSTLTTLSTPILFTDNNIGIVITLTNAAGTQYSTVLTPLLSVPGTPTIGTSLPGVYRDAANDDFQSTDFVATQGNLYLSLTTVAVPEPSTWAMMGLGLVAGAVVVRRRMVA